MDLQTIIAAIIVGAALIAVAIHTYRAFTGKSKSTCSCGCSSCGLSDSCNKAQKKLENETE